MRKTRLSFIYFLGRDSHNNSFSKDYSHPDGRFNYLSSSHLQSQVKSRREMMVLMYLVVVWICQFYRDVDWSAVVLLLFRSIYFWLRYMSVSFEVMDKSFVRYK